MIIPDPELALIDAAARNYEPGPRCAAVVSQRSIVPFSGMDFHDQFPT